jgi:hypothetical protein
MKSKGMSWPGHVAHLERMRNVYKNLVRRDEGKTSSLWRCEKLLFKSILCNNLLWYGLDSSSPRYGSVAVFVNVVINIQVA